MAWNDPPSFNYQQLSNSDRKFKHRYVLDSKLGQPQFVQPQAPTHHQSTMMNQYQPQPQQQPPHQLQYQQQPQQQMDQYQGSSISQFSDTPNPNNYANNNLVLDTTNNNFTGSASLDNYATNGTSSIPSNSMFPSHMTPAPSFPYHTQQQQQ